jgi:CheY-like chemotaxis protein
MSESLVTILLVEDNDDDVFLMQRALKEARIQMPLHVALDGQEALDYFTGLGRYSDRARYPIPALVFLDLKLPYVHGFEVLTWIRRQDSLSTLPVVILTSSPEERDRQKAKELGAQEYLVKPPTGSMLTRTLKFLPQPNQSAVS